MPRVFLSHSRKNNREAVALKVWLSERRPELADEIYLDIDPNTGMELGERWKGQLFRNNSRCETMICLLSKDWEASPECKTEYRTAEGFGKRILVARLEDLGDTDITSEWQRCDLFADGEQAEIDVPGGRPVRFNSAALRQLDKAIDGSGIGPETFAWPPERDHERAPYRGWVPFEDVDAGVFFGRDAAISKGLDELRKMRFRLMAAMSGLKSLFVVLGPSGSGKSSFLRAGLIPRLQRDDRRFVVLGIMRPERSALTGDQGFAAAIDSAYRALGLSGPPLGDVKKACLDRDSDRISQLLTQLREAAAERLNATSGTNSVESQADAGLETTVPTLVLPLDQAEELFSADAGVQAEQFLSLLSEVISKINAAEVGFIVASTIRTDRYEVMQNHPALNGIGTVLFDELKRMPPTQFTEVITGPAERASRSGKRLTIDADLVQRLIDDATEGADTLPLLALTLARLYTDYSGSGRLTLTNYESTGGMRDVVNNEIEQLLPSGAEDRPNALRRLRSAFIPWLATINPDSDQPMRRVARYTDLPVDSRGLIDALVTKRLLVKDVRDGNVVVEVALESLLRQWSELDGWLRRERRHLKIADDIERSAIAWQGSDRDPAWLVAGTRLMDAEKLAAKPGFGDRLNSTREYLAVCRDAENKRLGAEEEHREEQLRAANERRQAAESMAAAAQRHSRRLKQILAVTTVVAVVAVFSFLFYLRANRKATENLYEATASRLIAQAREMLTKGVDRDNLQKLLTGKQLSAEISAAEVYPMAARSADTRKIMENPLRPSGDDVIPVQSIAVSKDGSRIASGSNDHKVRIWDSDSGALLHTIDVGGQGPAWSVAFSPGGDRIATGNDDGVLQVWTADGRQKLSAPMNHDKPVNSIAFSRDGRFIATGGADGSVRVWDPASATEWMHIPPSANGTLVRSVAFSPKADLLVAGGDDFTVRLFDVKSRLQVGTPLVGSTPVMSVAFSPATGDRIVVGGLDGTIEVFDSRNLQRVGEPIVAHPNTINSVAFNTAGDRIVSGGVDNTVRVWDAVSHRPIGNPMVGHRGPVSAVAFNQDGTRIVSGSIDGSVREWDVVAGLPIPAGQGAAIRAVAFSPNGAQMASAGTDGTVKLWDAKTAAPIGVLGQPSPGYDYAINSLAFNPKNEHQIVTGSSDGNVRLWDTTGAGLVKTMPKEDSAGTALQGKPRIQSVAFSPDGTKIVSGGFDSMVRLWDTQSQKLIGVVSAHKMNKDGQPVPYQVWSVAFDPHGTQVVSGSGFDLDGGNQNNLIQVWDIAPTLRSDGAPIQGQSGWNIFSVGFSPDGNQIVSGSFDGTVRLWDVGSRTEAVQPMSGDQNPIFSVAFANKLEGNQNWVQSVAFSPDDKWILSGSADGNLHLWPAPQDLADTVCSKLTTNVSRQQWSQWVPSQVDYREICPDLPVASD
jgi:WD40 repeat protein